MWEGKYLVEVRQQCDWADTGLGRFHFEGILRTKTSLSISAVTHFHLYIQINKIEVTVCIFNTIVLNEYGIIIGIYVKKSSPARVDPF